jgi:hypothetical protein
MMDGGFPFYLSATSHALLLISDVWNTEKQQEEGVPLIRIIIDPARRAMEIDLSNVHALSER